MSDKYLRFIGFTAYVLCSVVCTYFIFMIVFSGPPAHADIFGGSRITQEACTALRYSSRACIYRDSETGVEFFAIQGTRATSVVVIPNETN